MISANEIKFKCSPVSVTFQIFVTTKQMSGESRWLWYINISSSFVTTLKPWGAFQYLTFKETHFNLISITVCSKVYINRCIMMSGLFDWTYKKYHTLLLSFPQNHQTFLRNFVSTLYHLPSACHSLTTIVCSIQHVPL